jgi:nicotinate-nucleotide pyrophosphorylase (carboxylating)
MPEPYLSDKAVSEFIQSALAEDLGEGDHSTLGSVPAGVLGKAKLLVKEDGIIAGIALAEKIFQQYDHTLSLETFKKDGDEIKKGEIVFIVRGPARSILSTERLVLNCLQRMSGIATYTHHLCTLIHGTRTQLLDTRKTTPNFRLMEKWAVAIGGGKNHRFALYDMVMLKDNHIDIAGGISNAVASIKKYLHTHHKALRIEIEARTLADVREAIGQEDVDVIMLDNMSLPDIRQAVALINGKCKIEASGGITETTIRAVAECGVDYVSVGALTHSARSLDLSLKIVLP